MIREVAINREEPLNFAEKKLSSHGLGIAGNPRSENLTQFHGVVYPSQCSMDHREIAVIGLQICPSRIRAMDEIDVLLSLPATIGINSPSDPIDFRCLSTISKYNPRLAIN